jgi:hypothetical protein
MLPIDMNLPVPIPGADLRTMRTGKLFFHVDQSHSLLARTLSAVAFAVTAVTAVTKLSISVNYP